MKVKSKCSVTCCQKLMRTGGDKIEIDISLTFTAENSTFSAITASILLLFSKIIFSEFEER